MMATHNYVYRISYSCIRCCKECIQCDLCILVLKEMFNDARAVTR